jgi:hypothetical protein
MGMTMVFYPHFDDVGKGTLEERIEVLLGAAERFKASMLDKSINLTTQEPERRVAPRDQVAAYQWEEISQVLSSTRALPESKPTEKMKKAELLSKLAEVYEVLRAAKMPKLEAVRLALISESNQLSQGTA